MGAGGEIITTFEQSWTAIQQRHPEVPDVVIITGTVAQRGGDRWGHHWPERWSHADAENQVPELFLAGELIAQGPGRVLTTMLHEAAHALAHVRGIKDTSRQGNRYHNRRFAALAAELGLSTPTKPTSLGYSDTTLYATTYADYAGERAAIEAARLAYLHNPTIIKTTTGGEDDDDNDDTGGDNGGGTRAGKRLKTACGCGRSLQVTPKTLEDGPVICGLCASPFEPPEDS